MKNLLKVKSLLLGAVLGAIVILAVAAAISKQTIYEYTIVSGGIRESNPTDPAKDGLYPVKRLNALAAEGWEAVGITCLPNDFSPLILVKKPKK